MRFTIVSIAAGLLLLPSIALATPVSWDKVGNVLQPLKSSWSDQIKGSYFTATSTATSTFTRAAITSSVSFLGDYVTNAATWIRSKFTAGDHITITNGEIDVVTSGTWSGNAGTASALAANGANCTAGQSPLGVDASGAVESCFDVWTEAENTAAGYLSSVPTTTVRGMFSGNSPISYNGSTGEFSFINPGYLTSVAWGAITGTLSSQTDLQAALDAKLSTTSAASTYYLQSNPANYISGNQTITLSGDVTGSGATSITTTIANGAVDSYDLATSSAFADNDIVRWKADGSFVGITCAELTGSADLCDGNDASGSGGGSISTSTTPTPGHIPWWSSTSALGSVATGTLSVGTGLQTSATRSVIGGAVTISAASGYEIPLIASTTPWQSFYTTPSSRITAGDALTWSGNTLNFDGGSAPGGSLGGTWASPTIDDLFILNTGDIGTGSYTFPSLNSTNATTTTLNVGGQVDFDGLTSAIVLTGASGILAEYAGTSCTNQFVRSLSALGAATCATVQNTDLANSTISYGGVSLSLGGSDATPAFALADATGLPIVGGTTGTLTVARGGTGSTTLSGILRGNGTSAVATLEIGSGLSYDGTTLSATGGGGGSIGTSTPLADTQVIYGTSASTIGSEAAFTYDDATNALTVGSLALTTQLSVANGGTGATTLTGLLQGNGTGAITGGATINNSNWSGTDLSVANGGTGLSTFGGSNHVLYTTGVDTLASEAAFTYDASTNTLSTDVLTLSGTGTLNGVDVIDATTEATIEAAMDTLPNVTSLGTLTGLTATGNLDFGGATFLEIPNGTAPTADDPGELAHDTSGHQLILDDKVVGSAVTKLFSVTVASTSPAFISGGLLAVPTHIDGYTITRIQCHVTSGTSKVIAIEDASANSSEDITCGTTNTTDDGTITNATYTASELSFIDFGSTTGSVDYVSISAFGEITRE